MFNFSRPQPRATIDVSKTLIDIADEMIHTRISQLPPRYLALGFGAIIRQLKLGIPGRQRPPQQARAHYLARKAGEYMFAGQYPRAMQRIIRSLRDAPYDSRLWRQTAVQLWDIWDIEAVDLTIELLEFAHWINPGNREVNDDLEEFIALRDQADDEEEREYDYGD